MMKPRVAATHAEGLAGGATSNHQTLFGITLPAKADEGNSSLISNDKNIMPSMVVKQQRGHLTKAQVHRAMQATEQTNCESQATTSTSTTPLDEILQRTRAAAADESSGRAGGQMFDQNGLILPRRVPYHHQQGDGQQPTSMRDLNRELKFNQKRGLLSFDQKSELKKAMEKLEASKRKKEAEQERLTRRTSLELRLEERAQRLARDSGTQQQPTSDGQSPTDSAILG